MTDKTAWEGRELKPCPFCGGDNLAAFGPTHEPNAPYNPADRSFPIVRCHKCYAEVPGANDDRSHNKRTAIAAWNTRALEAERDALREALEKAIPYIEGMQMEGDMDAFDDLQAATQALAISEKSE